MVNSRGQLVPAVSIPSACERNRVESAKVSSLFTQPRLSTCIGSGQSSHSSLQLQKYFMVVITHCQSPNTGSMA